MNTAASGSFDAADNGSMSLSLQHSHAFSSSHTTHGTGRPSFPLLAIFFAEFDNTVGPKITCQAPEGSDNERSRGRHTPTKIGSSQQRGHV